MRTTLSGITSRRPFTLLGIVLALLVIAAFVLVALNAGTGATVPQRTVVVATRDPQPRVPIDAGALATKQLHVDSTYPSVYFTQVSDVQGLIPLVTIGSGQAITANDVTKPNQALGAQSEYLPIPSGYVALTIPTSEEQGVAGYIQPGDYISVIASQVTKSTSLASKTIFTNLHVIKVGLQGTSPGGSATASSLTVVVTQCQAEFITWFLTFASLKYSLESYHDYLEAANQAPLADSACAKGVTYDTVKLIYPTLF
jgi:pilus assembly protein CpaB